MIIALERVGGGGGDWVGWGGGGGGLTRCFVSFLIRKYEENVKGDTMRMEWMVVRLWVRIPWELVSNHMSVRRS